MRWHGWKRGSWQFIISRFKKPAAGAWLPSLWSDIECKEADFSEECRQALKLHRDRMAGLGYVECVFFKVQKNIRAAARDSGSILYLHGNRRQIGRLAFHKVINSRTESYLISTSIGFSSSFGNGVLSYTNQWLSFDGDPKNEVVRLRSYDAEDIHRQFEVHLSRRNETPREFSDVAALREWFDANQISYFERQLQRGLYIRMTDQEIAVAKDRLANSKAPVGPSRFGRFRFEWWAVLIVILFAVQYFRSPRRVQEGSADTIDYQGQHFKMRMAYESYEDYKDDPNNLNTNELDRIEQTMVAAKIPTSFKDQNEFSHTVLFDLKFPGYGAALGLESKTDDGSKIEAASVEIPQRDKERYFVLRDRHGRLNLVDDFVFGTATNMIARVKLEKNTLIYYDEKGNKLREKSL